MPGNYKPELNYFMVSIVEKTRQFEHTSDVVIEAKNIVETVEFAHKMPPWYDENPSSCSFVFTSEDEVTIEVVSVVPITPMEFFERAMMERK